MRHTDGGIPSLSRCSPTQTHTFRKTLIQGEKLRMSVSIYIILSFPQAFLVAQMVKNLTAMQETRVRSHGQEDPLEKGMTTHSSILAWRIPWTEEPGGYSPRGCKELDMTERLTLGLPRWLSGKESTCQCRRYKFDPWIMKIPWRRK